jgi:ferric-dicitrate binding protein FerR (iron transport regulator)
MSQQRLQYLLDKLLTSDCTDAEKQELFQLIETVDDEPQLQDLLEGAWMRYHQPSHVVSEDRSATILKNILNENKVLPLRRKRKLWPYMAAASVIVLIGLAIYRLSLPATKGSAKPDVAAITNDVKAPDKSKATLTLAGGQEILLNEAQSGTLATENGSRVVMEKDGQLVYEKTGADNTQTAYNTLNNPRGSRVVTLTLPDGTRVWVNAGTSLTYPTAFAANERKVALIGEAYFEVKPLTPKGGEEKMPFVVKIVTPKGDVGEVRVLGTHFNVKAYDDEADANVTLLEGRVKVGIGNSESAIGNRQSAKNAERAVVLKPGEQAVLAATNSRFTIDDSRPAQTNGGLTVDHSPNLDQVMAWKEGLFDYKRSDITEVLRDAARWYDIEIVYEGKKPADTFTGGIDRTATLTELLTILQMTGVRFKLEGRKLIVLNGK